MMPAGDEAERVRERMAAALALIRSASPIRYACLQRDLPRILVGGTHALGECHFAVQICVLQFDYVIAPHTTPERIALTLIHEGTHARLARAGFHYHENQRARIERICVTAELLVARRLPHAESLVADAQARLPHSDAQWTNDAMLERRLRALRNVGGAMGFVAYWSGRALALFSRVLSRRAA
jgi:hypothetical protein